MTKIIQGRFIVSGTAMGKIAFASQPRKIVASDRPIDATKEIERFRQLVNRIADEMTRVVEELSKTDDSSTAEIVDSHRMMILDEEFHEKVFNLITAEFISAEKAAGKVLGEIASRLSSGSNAYLKQRSEDITDLIQQIQNYSIEKSGLPNREFAGDTILVVGKLFPSTVLACRDAAVKGIIVGEGVPTSHAAILAKSFGMPVVVDIHGVSPSLHRGEIVILDSEEQNIILNPGQGLLQKYRVRLSDIKLKSEIVQVMDAQPAATANGTRVRLLANLERFEELDMFPTAEFDGIGLFRTEFLFMSEPKDFPSFEKQVTWYRRIIEYLNPKPVTIRIVDIGGDKFLPYFSLGPQDNPYLGLRGSRIFRYHPEVLEVQLGAILEAAEFAPVRILYPMVNTVEDINFFRNVYDKVRQDYFADPQIGIMVETPAAVFQIEELLEEVDFISIGTNDLVQYSLTVDRNNQNVMDYFQPATPVIIRMLASIISAANEAGKPVSICGELASDSNWTRLLLGLGLREFSINPPSFNEIKRVLGEADIEDCEELAANVLECRLRSETEKLLVKFQNNSILRGEPQLES